MNRTYNEITYIESYFDEDDFCYLQNKIITITNYRKTK